MGHILVQVKYRQNGKSVNHTPRKFTCNLELAAALKVVAYIHDFLVTKQLNKNDVYAEVSLVNIEDHGVFTNLVKKYSPIPVIVKKVKMTEEVVQE